MSLSKTIQPEATARYFDDFLSTLTMSAYVDTNSGSSPPALSVATAAGCAGGWLQAPTKASTNDYRSISLGPCVELLAGGPVFAEARLKITEAAATSSSWFFGLVDVLTAGFLQTSGLPPSSYYGAVIYKPRGTNVISFETANGSTKWSWPNIGSFVSGQAILLGLRFDPNESGPGGASGSPNGSVRGLVNDQSNGPNFQPLGGRPIQLSGLVPLYLSAGVVASTSAAETMSVDFLALESLRV